MKKRAVWAFEWIGEVFICLIMHGNQNYDNWQKTFISRNSFSWFKRICQNSAKSRKKKRSSQSLPFDLCIDVNLFRVWERVNGVNVLWNISWLQSCKNLWFFCEIIRYTGFFIRSNCIFSSLTFCTFELFQIFDLWSLFT